MSTAYAVPPDVLPAKAQLENTIGAERLPLLAELAATRKSMPVDDVIEYCKEALQLLEDEPDPRLESNVRSSLSSALSRKGETDEALAEAQLAKELAVQVGNQAEEARAEYHVALAHWYRGEAELGTVAATRARELQSTDKDRTALAKTLTLLARSNVPRAIQLMPCGFISTPWKSRMI